MTNTAAKDTQDFNYCSVPLASYACVPDESRGRLHDEPESRIRTCFQRDKDRIIHSTAFRRLKYKTQVFIYHEGDHYRTRLTHTLEVAQIARSMARALMVNEDLAETVALAHDLGHPPFAHLGEQELEVQMEPYGGFEHNDQTLAHVVRVEERYPSFDGLNLTWESLEGIVKHNGPVEGSLPYTLEKFNTAFDLKIDTYASLEAQIAALADDIAYNNHDLEDGIKAGLFDFEQFKDIRLVQEVMAVAEEQYPGLERHRYIAFVIREMIGEMVFDVINETRKRLSELNPQSPDDIRNAGRQMVEFSPSMLEKVNELRKFLWSQMYNDFRVRRTRYKSRHIVRDLFTAFMEDPLCLPKRWQEELDKGDGSDTAKARVVADYIAGMTDRYAIVEHKRLFDLYEDHR